MVLWRMTLFKLLWSHIGRMLCVHWVVLLYVGGMFVMAYNCYRTIKMPSVPEHIAEPEEVNTGSEQATAQA